ncbi:penicillin-binding protein 2 [Tepidimonas ignava]|uniref:Peptidoglycan D,D-transpeptidase MrdA n=1 Tax=Tepidimonas ignava TaxID=114249 RepID=A0A4R3LD50_9BURK|nr:penicillin-binding protein 2 [Tepidimonas ignava]TCS97260.1 penicillin-binding protein 2 [Tepidimonas ignava]TSE21246.1 Peptidoglycan D,D-transpeptidase MrdA [Tepidimonas ignava]
MALVTDPQDRIERQRRRAWVALGVAWALLGLLGVRAYVLQVLHHDRYVAQAEGNRTAVVPLLPTRGRILDRHGVVLADHVPVYTLEVTPGRTPDLEATLQRLGELVELTPRDLQRFRRLRAESKRFDPLPLKSRLSEAEMARVAAHLWALPGVEIQARQLRRYPLGTTAAHVVGYIGRISERDRAQMDDWPDERLANYRGTTHIGKVGVEAAQEERLHGRTGLELLETTATGRAVRRLGVTPAQAGDDIRLALDVRLQHLVERLYGRRRGALVALDAHSGEVLALVSMPTFDPNLFVDGIDSDSWRELNESLDRPLLNRALRGTYPPGSTYKPFMALAALELGLRTPQTAVLDPGYWTLGNHRFRSHGETALGMVDLRRSIVLSSNVYYYTLAHEMGVQAIHDFMAPLGFGQLTGIDLPGEVRGILPSPAWKRAAYRQPEQQRWHPGETISLGIGQGYNSFTMLQLATAVAALANGGQRMTPHVALQALPVGQPPQALAAAQPPRPLGYRPEHLRVVLDAMVGVTTEGTAARAFAGAPYRSGGKTGTAQAVTIGQRERYDAARLAEYQRDHSLYVAFAPAEAPRYVVAAIVENAGFGAAHAAPIVRRVFDYLLLGLYPSEEDIAATQKGQTAAPIGVPRRVEEVPWPPRP